MARNLVSAGLRTTAWDRSSTAAAPLSDAGALVAASPAEAVRDAQVVITMLPTAGVVTSRNSSWPRDSPAARSMKMSISGG